MEQGYLKGNVRAVFIDLKRMRYKELVFCVIQREGTCQFQYNIKDFLTVRPVQEKRLSHQKYTSRVRRSVGRKP